MRTGGEYFDIMPAAKDPSGGVLARPLGTHFKEKVFFPVSRVYDKTDDLKSRINTGRGDVDNKFLKMNKCLFQ